MNRKLFIFTVVLVLCCFMATGTWAAKKVNFTKSNAKEFIDNLNGKHGNPLGLSDDDQLVKISEITDFNGETHIRYQQAVGGIPLWGVQTVISKKGDKVMKLHGSVVHGAKNDLGNFPKKFDARGALTNMKEDHKAKNAGAVWHFDNETAGTYVYFHKKSKKARLCYVVSFFADNDCGDPSRPVFFVDAKNGKIIDSFDSLAYAYDGTGPGGNQKVGQYYYGTDFTKFGVAVNGSTCTMNYADCRSVNLNHGTSGSTPYSYTCYENTFKAINGAYSPINDAQFFGQQIYNMYMDWYGVPVLPFQLMMRVHYSTNYENAFWNGSSMTFGDGYTTFYPLVALDVSAHEVAHGFTENNSGLIYSSQSGGINESYSDMAGEAAKFYMRGTNDFMCGYDIFKNPSQALRYLCNPPQDGVSIDHVSQYYEGLDVHYSSGIFNKAFCLIAQSSGWTTRMAFDVFTRANQVYWTPGTTFQQGADGAVDAAIDLGYNCGDVQAAFSVVGITVSCPGGPPVADFSGSPTAGPFPLTVNFTDQSSNGPTSWSWNFGDTGTSSAQNPSHQYTAAGTYTVTLTATNAAGSDQEVKIDYITVTDPSQTPEIFVYNIYMQKFVLWILYRAEATITIWDTNNQVVPNATVYIQWSGKASGTSNGVTNASGQVTFNSGWYWGNGTFTCTVTNVTHATMTYNSSLNNETSDSI
jgi:Zn-dependent metalloprotease